MPVNRNQDGLFGLILRICCGNAYFAHLPSAIVHAPAEERSFDGSAVWKTATRFHLCDVIAACVMSFEYRADVLDTIDTKDRLGLLGKHLITLGTMPLTAFEEVLRIQTFRLKGNHIVALENLLAKYNEAPAYWARDVRKYIGVLREALLRENYILPQDISLQGRRPEDVRRQTQRLVYKFGQLLHWWTEIIETARRLRTQNRRLAVPI